ncbi:hypothetical protein F2Q68_00017284 [Brassica cretica]|uniref:DYW domain-containing protein n=1 Tax=Brassica cretica TaxID=69181 RepID=A0A8S9HEB6_BRACR|nr:hypothetical protein F2Q68_00017284 [Brassica cretica]
MRGIDQVEEDAVILGAFLNACNLNKNTELVKEVEEKLLEIDGCNGSRYIHLANSYASSGRWDEMRQIRNRMRGKELGKFYGCSWAYIDNQLHMFRSSDISHFRTEAIYSLLHFIAFSVFSSAVIVGHHCFECRSFEAVASARRFRNKKPKLFLPKVVV